MILKWIELLESILVIFPTYNLALKKNRHLEESSFKYPRFSGQSFLLLPSIENGYKEFSVAIEFRSETSSGLIVLGRSNSDRHPDYFAIFLKHGYVHFRFDCGSGDGDLRTSEQIKPRDWNTIVVHRNYWNASLVLNKFEKVSGKSQGQFFHINSCNEIYVGGYSDDDGLKKLTSIQTNMTGCIRQLHINGRSVDLRTRFHFGQALHSWNVDSCASSSCKHMDCWNGGTCLDDFTEGYVCLCPLGTTGINCEQKNKVDIPLFSKFSYLQYIGLQRSVLSYTEIMLIIKPHHSRNGLLLYNGYSRNGTGDFLAIYLENGYVIFSFDLGTGHAVIRSMEPVTFWEWNTIWAARTGRVGFLKVNDQQMVEGIASGAFTQLTLLLELFIGGHKNYDEVSSKVEADTSFEGCIQKLIINKRTIQLLEEAMTGVNLKDCNHACSSQPCLNGGRCVPNLHFYKCNCPLGFVSRNCEKNVSRAITTPYFFGNSYLLFIEAKITERLIGKTMNLSLRFKTSNSDGLMMWITGDDVSEYGDFFAVGMKGGYVSVTFNLGSGESHVVHNLTRTDDGIWHTLQIFRDKKIIYLYVDDSIPIKGVSSGLMTHLTAQGALFIGGMEDVAHGTFYKYSTGFVGCMNGVALSPTFELNLIDDADDGINIDIC